MSLELEFSKKEQNPLEQAISVLFDVGPNGYATGFLVGNGLVMTAYHVISGNLSTTKKVMLGFKASDELTVKVFVDGCRAKVIKVDKEADLALLEMCRNSKNGQSSEVPDGAEQRRQVVSDRAAAWRQGRQPRQLLRQLHARQSGVLVSEDRQPRRFFGKSGLQLERGSGGRFQWLRLVAEACADQSEYSRTEAARRLHRETLNAGF